MGKLHELLAVETSLEGAANKLIAESKKTFNKETLFNGQVRNLTYFDENNAHLNHKEYQKLTTTVSENIEYLEKPITDYWDALLNKESANQQAVADLIVEGVKVAEALPATFLLGIESRLVKLRELYDNIPTLAPGIEWVPAPEIMKHAFKTGHTETTFKTEKDPEFRIVVEATKEHPAQVERIERTSNVGKYETVKYSGMMSPAEKAHRIERIDSLLRAVRKARSRANMVEVQPREIGKSLLDFINTGSV